MAVRRRLIEGDRYRETDREKHIDLDSRGRQVDGDRLVCRHSQTNRDIFAGGQTEKEMIDSPGRDSCVDQTETAVPTRERAVETL